MAAPQWAEVRVKPGCLIALVTMLMLPATVQAGSSFLVSSPVPENDTIVMTLGGLSEDGVTLQPTSVQVEIDGAPAAPPWTVERLFAHAESTATKNPQARSPLAVGLVYLWIKEVPPALSDALLEGVTGFLRRLPSGTPTHATLYGRKRQAIPRLKAPELANTLHDVSFLSGDRPNLADAIRLAAKALAGDEGALKVLLVVTDGRDFADPTGQQPGDFVALADELTRAQVRLLLVSFPAPEAEAEASARNLSALVGTGLQRVVEQPSELQSTLESLGQFLADLRQVRLEIPWWWRTWGGTHRVRLTLVINGRPRALDVGKVTLPSRGTPWLLLVGGLLAALLAAGAWRMRSRRPREPAETLLDAANDLIEQGMTARRAIISLSRRFPREVGELATHQASDLADAGYPALQTKAGQRRFEEMVALLKRGDETRLGDDLASALAQAISEKLPAEQAAARLTAQVAEDELSAFARLGLQPLASALRQAGERHPELAAPRARALALAMQEALHLPHARVRSVGWLVRAAGPGKRGESLCLGKTRVVLGRSESCDLRLQNDASIAEEHTVLDESQGQFTIEPLQGSLKVEDQTVTGPHPLHDGDTVALGESRFVWKCVSR